MSDEITFGLTPRARELLNYLRERFAKTEVGPTYREMADAIGLSGVASVHRIVVQLEKRGFVRRIPGASRSIDLVEYRTFVLPKELVRRIRLDAADRGRTPEQHLADAVRAFCPQPAANGSARDWRSSPTF